VAHPVNAKPGFLQQVIGVDAADNLRGKESMQLRAKLHDEIRGSVEIALLVMGHEVLEIAVRRHAMDRLPAILIDSSRFVQTASPNPGFRLMSSFVADKFNSLACDRKLRFLI